MLCVTNVFLLKHIIKCTAFSLQWILFSLLNPEAKIGLLRTVNLSGPLEGFFSWAVLTESWLLGHDFPTQPARTLTAPPTVPPAYAGRIFITDVDPMSTYSHTAIQSYSHTAIQSYSHTVVEPLVPVCVLHAYGCSYTVCWKTTARFLEGSSLIYVSVYIIESKVCPDFGSKLRQYWKSLCIFRSFMTSPCQTTYSQ